MSKTIYTVQIGERHPQAFTTRRAVTQYLGGIIKHRRAEDEQYCPGLCMGDFTEGAISKTGAMSPAPSLFDHLWESYSEDLCLRVYFVKKTEHYGDNRCHALGSLYSGMMWQQPGESVLIKQILMRTQTDVRGLFA